MTGTGVKTLADGRIALYALTTRPKNLKAPTLEELNKGKKISCRILKSDYRLGSTGSSTVEEQEMCKKGAGKAPGPAEFEGHLTVFRYLDEAGMPVIADDFAWTLFKTAGAQLWLVEREGPEESSPFAQNQEVCVYEVITGQPRKPDDRFVGYIKRVIDLHVQDAEEDALVAAA